MRQRKSSGLKYQYKKTNEWAKNFSKRKKIPKGTWLPISVVAHLTNYSVATIRNLCINKVARAIRFPVGPVLVNYEDIKTNWLEN